MHSPNRALFVVIYHLLRMKLSTCAFTTSEFMDDYAIMRPMPMFSSDAQITLSLATVGCFYTSPQRRIERMEPFVYTIEVTFSGICWSNLLGMQWMRSTDWWNTRRYLLIYTLDIDQLKTIFKTVVKRMKDFFFLINTINFIHKYIPEEVDFFLMIAMRSA